MPITLKQGMMAYRDNEGEYHDINVVAEATTANQIAAIQSAGTSAITSVQAAEASAISSIQTAGQTARESIPNEYTELSDSVDDLKSAINNINDRFDIPNVMDYSSLLYDERFVQTDGQIRPTSDTNSVIFAVDPNTTYYLQIVGGFNRRNMAGNNTGTFETYSTYTPITTQADGTTGVIFTTTANINYVFLYFYSGTYVYNANNFRLYKGTSVPSDTTPIIKKTSLPSDIVYEDSEILTDIKTEFDDAFITEHDVEFSPFFQSDANTRIAAKLGRFATGGKLAVDNQSATAQVAIQAFSGPNYATKVTETPWIKNKYEWDVSFDYYYLLVFAKRDWSAFQSLNDISDVKITHVNSSLDSPVIPTPLTSLTVKSIAHRGDILLAPQNTAPSYIIARKEGHTIGENDVWVSSDGEYVMEHDTSLSRLGNLVDINGYEMYTNGSTIYYYDADNSNLYTYTTDYVASSVDVATLTRCSGANYAVTDLPLAVLKRIDFGVYKGDQFKGTQILTFDEWILLMKQLGMDAYIDHKIGYTVPVVTALANIVKKYGMLDHVSWIGVPAADTIEAIRSIDPNARIGVLDHPNSTNVVTYAPYNTGRGFFFNGNIYDGFSEAAVQLGINAGFEVETYFVGYEYPMEKETDIFAGIKTAMSYGVTGITLDHFRVDDAIRADLNRYYIS